MLVSINPLSQSETTRFDAHSLVVLCQGTGVIQVDFNNYHVQAGRGIFLAPGQYLKLISGNLTVQTYSFQGDLVNQYKNARYLFKHLVSLGYIELEASWNGSDLGVISNPKTEDGQLLSNAIARWMKLNPFRVSSFDLDLLFDVKDYVDSHFNDPVGVGDVAEAVGASSFKINGLTKKKLATTVHRLMSDKRLLEAQRRVAFTSDTTKEIAYELGFSQPTYFNRFFKQGTSFSPNEFREQFHFEITDPFIEDFNTLLDTHFRNQRFLSFYAEQLFMSTKKLSQKLHSEFGSSFPELIGKRLMYEAKTLLDQQLPVMEVADYLGFKEPNHLTSFFKKHSGISPTTYVNAQK